MNNQRATSDSCSEDVPLHFEPFTNVKSLDDSKPRGNVI